MIDFIYPPSRAVGPKYTPLMIFLFFLQRVLTGKKSGGYVIMSYLNSSALEYREQFDVKFKKKQVLEVNEK